MICQKCNFQNAEEAKFCRNCGGSLIEALNCPNCKKVHPAGKKFCDECGAALVSQSGRIVPRCEKCGKEYADGTKFCPMDGGRIGDTGTTEQPKSLFSEARKSWHPTTFVLSIILTAFYGLLLLGKLIEMLFGFYFYFYLPGNRITCFISLIVTGGIIFSTVLLWKLKKVGFTLFVIFAGITIMLDIFIFSDYYYFLSAIHSYSLTPVLFSIVFLCTMLHKKKNGISAWNTLK